MTLHRRSWARHLAPLLAVAVAAPVVTSCTQSASSGEGGARIRVAFRLDDYSTQSPTDLELLLLREFETHGRTLTIGVIPHAALGDVHDSSSAAGTAPLTDEKAAILREAVARGIADVAMHGHTHRTIRPSAPHSEFAGLDGDTQRRRLETGKRLLDRSLGREVDTFIPPWNTYDRRTLDVLGALGFSAISADPNGVAAKADQLQFMPATCDLTGLRDAIEAARAMSDPAPVIVVLFHHYDFRGFDGGTADVTLEQFADLLRWTASQPDVDVVSLSQLLEDGLTLDARRLLANRRLASIAALTPGWLRPATPLSRGVYASIGGAGDLQTRFLLRLAGFWLVIVLGGVGTAYMVGVGVLPAWPGSRVVLKYGSVAVLLAGSAYAFRDAELGFRGGVTVMAGIGLCVGSWLAVSRWRHEPPKA